jgi:hypothetical protein
MLLGQILFGAELWQRLLGGQRLRMADYVMGTAPTDAATAAGGW